MRGFLARIAARVNHRGMAWKTKTLARSRIEVERQDRNGVKVKVTRTIGVGSSVEADCLCYGIVGRVHDSERCPVLRKSRETAKNAS